MPSTRSETQRSNLAVANNNNDIMFLSDPSDDINGRPTQVLRTGDPEFEAILKETAHTV